MKTLWIYGCSFSEPFGLEGGPEYDQNGYRQFYKDFWGTHLARKLSCDLKSKSCSGIGWNYISDKIDEDLAHWNTDDIIIISPSFFTRVTYEETLIRNVQEIELQLFKDSEFIFNYNESRWKKKIETLQKFGFNVYTWVVENTKCTDLKNLIYAEGFSCWKDWLDNHKEFWIDPTTKKYPLGDWHFNEKGHERVSEIMFEFICKPR